MPKQGKTDIVVRKRGRVTLLTPQLERKICQLVAGGAPLPFACPAAGVSWMTARDWFTADYCEREPYKSFCEAVEAAKADHAVGCALRITKAGKRGIWNADLAILERRHPEHYRPGGTGRRLSVELDEPAASEDGTTISDAELEVIVRTSARRT